MHICDITIEIKGKKASFSKADNKESIKEKLGAPDYVAGHYGISKIPLIFVYDEIEFHFDRDDSLRMLFQDQIDGPESSVTLCVDFRKTY